MKDYSKARKNYRIVSRIMLWAFLLLMVAELIVAEQPAHRILRYLSGGFAAAYIFVTVMFYAKPGLFDDKLNQQPD